MKYFYIGGSILLVLSVIIALIRGTVFAFYIFPLICFAFIPLDLFFLNRIHRNLYRENYGPIERVPILGPWTKYIAKKTRKEQPQMFSYGAGVTFLMFCMFCVLASLTIDTH